MSGLARKCYEQLQDYMKSIPDFNNQVFPVYNVTELRDLMAAVTPPGVGIMYNGMHGGNKQTGLAASITFTLLMLLNTERFGATKRTDGSTNRVIGMDLMDEIRDKIKKTRSPSAHFWQFVLEAPALEQKGLVVWAQQWSCPVLLTP